MRWFDVEKHTIEKFHTFELMRIKHDPSTKLEQI